MDTDSSQVNNWHLLLLKNVRPRILFGVLLLLMDVYSGDGRWDFCVTDLSKAWVHGCWTLGCMFRVLLWFHNRISSSWTTGTYWCTRIFVFAANQRQWHRLVFCFFDTNGDGTCLMKSSWSVTYSGRKPDCAPAYILFTAVLWQHS
jgi:hypothetical protein